MNPAATPSAVPPAVAVISVVVAVAVVALAAWTAGCGIVSSDPWERRREALERNRERWTDEAIEAYRYTVSKSCECIAGFVGPVRITVSAGAITSVERVQTGEPVPEEDWPGFDTVEELFALVEQAIDDRAYAFDVEYDAAHGHPTLVSLDFDRRVADDEVVIGVEELTVLESEHAFRDPSEPDTAIDRSGRIAGRTRTGDRADAGVGGRPHRRAGAYSLNTSATATRNPGRTSPPSSSSSAARIRTSSRER